MACFKAKTDIFCDEICILFLSIISSVSEAATENLVSAVNSLAGGDLETEDLAKKADITKK